MFLCFLVAKAKRETGSIIRVLEWVSEVAQLCLTLCDPMDCSLPGSSVHWIFQARILEWAAISFSRGSSWPRDRTQVSRIVGRCFTVWATRELLRRTLFLTLRSKSCCFPGFLSATVNIFTCICKANTTKCSFSYFYSAIFQAPKSIEG